MADPPPPRHEARRRRLLLAGLVVLSSFAASLLLAEGALRLAYDEEEGNAAGHAVAARRLAAELPEALPSLFAL